MRRPVLLLAAAVLAAPVLVGTLGAATAADPPAKPTTPATPVCADPAALRPALAPTRPGPVDGLSTKQARRLRGLTAAGRAAGMPARAQAVALTAWLASHDPATDRVRLGAGWGDLADTAFYRRLRQVDDWRVLSPSVAAHRVLGTPDPYVFDDTWNRALTVLGQLTGRTALEAASEVTTGGALGSKCYADALDQQAFPLPAGTGYRIVQPRTKQARDTDAAAGSTSLVDAPCGTPVLAAISGVASVRRDVRRAGPWLVTVSQDGGPTTTYAHVGRPGVTDGSPVVVGQQVATVGDYGDVGRCSLGFGLRLGGTVQGAVATVAWLARAALPDLVVPTGGGPVQTVFRMAQLNVLGSHLTEPGAQKASYASGPQRMRAALQMLDAAQASIVTLEEFETPAADVVEASPDWQLFRSTPNNRFRNGNTNGNAIAWRRDQWTFVDSVEFTVPWQVVTLHMPVVRLRNKASGAEVVVVGVHNPATTRRQGDQSRARAVAREIEVKQIKAFAEQTELPIILAGDFNESSAATCDLLGAGLTTYSTGGDCAGAGRGRIDLIFGYGDLDFTASYLDFSPQGSITDHPVAYADVSLPPPTS